MASVSAAKPKRAKIDFESLYRQNSVLVVLYLLEAAAILVAATAQAFPVTLNFLGLDSLATSAAKGEAVLTPASHHLFDVRLVWMLALMFGVSSLAYLLTASWCREFYEKSLAKRANPIRAVLHGVSAGLGMLAIGILVGVRDASALLMLFTLILGTHGLYALAEYLRPKLRPQSTATFWIGTAFGLVAWLMILITAWSSHIYGAGVPSYLHVLAPAIFVLSGAISANFYLQLCGRGKWADMLYGERVFVIISFVLQTLLAWGIFAGSLRP